MSAFLITYDNKPPRDYRALYELMIEWDAVMLAESVWLANLRGPASTIREIVLETLQPNDVVAVIEVKRGSDWATNWVGPQATAFLSRNVATVQLAA
jgi:uncharacterized protein with PhoU and TrkA domain